MSTYDAERSKTIERKTQKAASDAARKTEKAAYDAARNAKHERVRTQAEKDKAKENRKEEV